MTDNILLSYTAGGTNPIEDLAGNDAPNFTDQAVTNNITLTSDFIMEIEITSAPQTFTLPLMNGTSTGTVNMDDGNGDQVFSTYNDPAFTTSYGTNGTKTIRILSGGNILGINFSSSSAADKAAVRRVLNYGNIQHNANLFSAMANTGLTSFVFGETQTQNAINFESFFGGCANLTTVDFTGLDLDSATIISRMCSDTASLASVVGLSTLDTSAVQEMDEMFYTCPSLDHSTLDISNWDVSGLAAPSGGDFKGMFNFIDNGTALDADIYNAFLINADSQVITSGVWFGFKRTPHPTSGAAATARTSLINKGINVEDNGNAAPEVAAAPSATVISSTQIDFTLPSDPFCNGLQITDRTLEVIDITNGGAWTAYATDLAEGATVNVTGRTPNTGYQGRVVYTNPKGDNQSGSGGSFNSTAGTATTTVTTNTEATTVVVTANGQELESFVDSTNTNALTVTINGVAYSQNKANADAAFTPADLAGGAIVCLKLPELTGSTVQGQTLTVTPAYWLYDSAQYSGDPTNAIINNTDGSRAPNTLTYATVNDDVGDTLRVDETFNGTTVSSANTGTITTGASLITLRGTDLATPFLDPSSISTVTTEVVTSMNFGPDEGYPRKIIFCVSGFFAGNTNPGLLVDTDNYPPNYLGCVNNVSTSSPNVAFWEMTTNNRNGARQVRFNTNGNQRLEVAFHLWTFSNVTAIAVEGTDDQPHTTATSILADVVEGGALLMGAISGNASAHTPKIIDQNERFNGSIRSGDFAGFWDEIFTAAASGLDTGTTPGTITGGASENRAMVVSVR